MRVRTSARFRPVELVAQACGRRHDPATGPEDFSRRPRRPQPQPLVATALSSGCVVLLFRDGSMNGEPVFYVEWPLFKRFLPRQNSDFGVSPRGSLRRRARTGPTQLIGKSRIWCPEGQARTQVVCVCPPLRASLCSKAVRAACRMVPWGLPRLRGPPPPSNTHSSCPWHTLATGSPSPYSESRA